MVYIDKDYKRLLRIYARPGISAGHTIEVYDDETIKPINNIKSMVIRLGVAQVNECEITYLEMDGNGKLVVDQDRNAIENTITLPSIHIDGISAYEIDTWEQEFDRTFCLYEPTEDGYENVEGKVKAFIRQILRSRR